MLTFAIPYHSRPDLLYKTLLSLSKQSSNKWTAFICDDSGTNDITSVLTDFSELPISHVRNSSSQGISANWNFCTAHVETEYFTLLHADDELETDYTSHMLELATQFPEATLYYCRVTVIGQSGNHIFSFPDLVKSFIAGRTDSITFLSGEKAACRLLSGNFIFCPSVMYRKSVFPTTGFDTSYSQVMDLDLFMRLLLTGHTFIGSPQKLYRYRRHKNNLTSLQTSSLLRFKEEVRLYSSLVGQCDHLGWKAAVRKAKSKRIIKMHLLYRLLGDALHLRTFSILRKLRFFYQLHFINIHKWGD